MSTIKDEKALYQNLKNLSWPSVVVYTHIVELAHLFFGEHHIPLIGTRPGHPVWVCCLGLCRDIISLLKVRNMFHIKV